MNRPTPSLAQGPARPRPRDAGAARLAVVVINWNLWADTLECLESLLRSDAPARVILVDNGSDNDSVDRILGWASGAEPWQPPAGPLRRLTDPPIAKPVAIDVLSDDEALARPPSTSTMLTLIRSSWNRGFSGGNNLGLRHALGDPAIAYCWCLNNDTVVMPDAVRAIVARMDATPKVGLCGTQIRFYDRPGTWQLLNGQRFRLLTGTSRGIGKGLPVTRPVDPRQVARETDFVQGASLAVSRAFLDTVGFMDESYFLYFEEMDWAIRNRGRFATAFAHSAIVYHKEGGSAGSSTKPGQRSAASEYYLMRSRIRFYRRNFPLLWPLQYPLAIALIGRRLLRRQPDKAVAMTKAMLGLRR